MAKKKGRKKKNQSKIRINKYHVSILVFLIWFMYYFTYFYAPSSPIYRLLNLLASMLFWEQWWFVFFWLLIIIGILVLIKEDIFHRRIFLKLFLLMITIWAILNFPYLENKSTEIWEHWWLFWYFELYVLNLLLGNQISAIKIMSIIIFLVTFIRIYRSLWFRFNFTWIHIDIQKPEPKKKVTQNEKTSETGTIKKEKWSILSLFDQKKLKNEEIVDNSKSDKILTNDQEKPEKETLKRLLKKKIEDKVTQKSLTQTKIEFPKDKPSFKVGLLEKSKIINKDNVEEAFLIEKSEALRIKLEEFWIPVSIEWFNIWPTVIQIKIKPQAWIKVSRIENLKKDISLALKSKSLRIIAPIPWTDSVWIELANPKPSIVRLWDILWDQEFSKSMSSFLTNLSLWKGIDWKIIIKPLEKMPHMLVAWATWAWKSVWVNDFILSLMFQNSPSELRFIMIDPKQVELWIYEGLPYLLSPIITEPEKAVKVLKWTVWFMNERYQKLKKIKVRNVDEYNNKVEEKEKMYRLIVIIDELADLMMSWNKKDTENAIARIAQMARAVGIHLIVATQRPSVNVITWLIKANIPTRVAFWVVSQVDSRTILDVKWAEDLVWKWDMLYSDPNNKYPIRIQAPYVSTLETEEIVNELKEKYMKWISEEQIYHPEIVNILSSKAEVWGFWEWWSDDEELVQQAINIISETRKASATLLQRKLWVWFARAARIMDILEDRWIVWPQEWAKPREILI